MALRYRFQTKSTEVPRGRQKIDRGLSQLAWQLPLTSPATRRPLCPPRAAAVMVATDGIAFEVHFSVQFPGPVAFPTQNGIACERNKSSIHSTPRQARPFDKLDTLPTSWFFAVSSLPISLQTQLTLQRCGFFSRVRTQVPNARDAGLCAARAVQPRRRVSTDRRVSHRASIRTKARLGRLSATHEATRHRDHDDRSPV
jgi:hypothetical protein